MTPPTSGPSHGWWPAVTARVRLLQRRAERYARRRLVWNTVYRTTSYLRSALWIVPFLSILMVFALAPLLLSMDGWIAWRIHGLTASGAESLYQSVISLTLSFVVFTFGSLLVAIQVASGQLTPRIIATTLLRDPVVKYSVGLFVFTLVFAITALNRLDTVTVQDLVTLITAALGAACMATFLFLIDYAARLLRPVSILARVGDEGHRVIDAVYPNPVRERPDTGRSSPAVPDKMRRVVAHEGTSEVLLAIDLDTVVREARRTNGVIEFVPRVGDFVATDETLFVLYGNATAADDTRLRAAVALGRERTMEQDPLFSFRIMVDIGLKALSPAINDPTTAVLAIDQIHRLMRIVGNRDLGSDTIIDGLGRPRVVYHAPRWEDFVHLTCTELRMNGAANVQIARRLRAMLINLIDSVPPARRTALEQEGRKLTLAIEGAYRLPDDLALARVADSQGLGGAAGRH